MSLRCLHRGYDHHEVLHVVCLLITEPLLTGIPILHLQGAHPEVDLDPELHPQGGTTFETCFLVAQACFFIYNSQLNALSDCF